MLRIPPRLIPMALLIAAPSFGYVRLTTCTNTAPPATGTCAPVPLQRVDNTGIQFAINTQIVAGVQSSASGQTVTVISPNSNPQAATRAALTSWNNVNANATFLPLQTTTLGHALDGNMVIVIASSPDDVSAVGSALAITSVFSATSGGQDPYNSALTLSDGSIVDTDILLNPGTAFSTDGSTSVDLQAVLTHELGHSLGADHTGVFGATMFQYNHINQRFLTTDDLAFVNSVYPATGSAQSFGTISGTVTANGVGVPFALLGFVDNIHGVTLGGLSNADGTYSIQVPAGTYTVYAEPFDGVVTTGFLYLTYLSSGQLAAIPTFQPTVLSGLVTVTANNAVAGTNVAVTGGASPFAFTNTLVGLGAAGANGDISSLSGLDGPIQIASGQSVDIAFAGVGFVSALSAANFQVFGAGINITGVHVDTRSTVNSLPLIRVTLKIPALASPQLATIFVSTIGGTFSLTGGLVVVPPAPSFVPQDAVSAASNIVGNGTVSPGEYVTLYGTGVSPTTGPFAGIGYTNTGYIMGFLPPNLGGTSVTFDGVPAPIFFTGGGGQINLQVPFEVAGKTSTQVVASFFGSPSTTVALPVAPATPALFTFPNASSAYAANQDGSINGVNNPAALGSYITVVGTGIGLPSYAGTAYPIQTGAAAPAPPASALNANGYTCTVGGVAATVAFTGYYTGYTAETEWIVQLPSSLTTSGAVPIQFTDTATGASTQSALSIYIK